MKGYCGQDCEKCDAYIATKNKNDELLELLAQEWSNEDYPLEPEDIICLGCKSSKKKFIYCNGCDIRKCAQNKRISSCDKCSSYPCDLINKNLD